MKNSEWWEQRVANETWRTYNSLEEKNRDLLKMYQEASLDLQEELYQVTQKVNGGQGVSLSDMHKHNRLTNLQKNMEYRIRQLGEDVEKFGKDNMKSGIKDVYSNVIGSLDVSNFSLPNEKLMEKMFNTPWQSDTFSNRLWKNTQKLATNLNDILTIGLTQGKTVTEMAINLNNQMNQGFNVSHRLIRTETMHYLNESAFKAYEDGGCTEVQLWAAEDERMCDICGARHGTKYKLKDRPTLPLHANCRCTYLPVVDMNKVEENNKALNKDGTEIKFELGNMKEDKAEEVKTVISDLVNQYNTLLEKVSKGNSKTGVMFSSKDNTMYLLGNNKTDIVHEFAHSIAVTDNDRDGLTNDKDFWKEIKRVRNEYEKECRTNPDVSISTYSHSKSKAGSMLDEFMAEAFTHATLKGKKELLTSYGNNYKYSDKVLEIVNKYFKKDI